MKKIAFLALAYTVLVAPANAADIAPAPVMDWTGLYIGGFVGGGWGTTDIEGERGSGHGGDEESLLTTQQEENGKGGPSLDL